MIPQNDITILQSLSNPHIQNSLIPCSTSDKDQPEVVLKAIQQIGILAITIDNNESNHLTLKGLINSIDCTNLSKADNTRKIIETLEKYQKISSEQISSKKSINFRTLKGIITILFAAIIFIALSLLIITIIFCL